MRPADTLGDIPRAGLGPLARPLFRGKVYLAFTRPFTLLPPLLGVVSGAITAFGSAHNPDPERAVRPSVILTVALGSICAALLNAASNGINQIYDLEIDRRNKPARPLVAGTLSRREGWWISAALYLLALVPTWLVVVHPYRGVWERLHAPLARHECFFLFLAGAILTWVYSAPAFGRTKRLLFWANVTIAVPRGCLLKVAGWSLVASVFHLEPWYIGLIFFLFLLGATSTKDFSDMEGDRAHGCITLPIRFGVARASRILAPFFVAPWLLMPLGAWLPDPFAPERRLLTGNPAVLALVGVVLAAWGVVTVRLILRDPEELARTENHPSWTQMYLMMMFAQTGFAVAYLV
jgi:4-hydroxybenzoate polyprenyltransferase